MSPLFTPFTFKNLKLSNRIVMAPMTRSQSPGGVPGENVAGYYRRRAENGVGLILTEGVGIDHPAALNDPGVPWFHGAAPLAGWARVLEEVRKAGGHIMPQLWHVGTQRKPGSSPNPEVAPVGAMMPESEIAKIVDAYARGAEQAKRLGFDGIELHGAHGYLIDQFFWEQTNQRTDRYGEDRTLFAQEVVRACRAAVGPEFPILLRFSQWKIGAYDAKLAKTPEELAAFLAPLVAAGVDVFHASTRRFWEPEFEGSPLNLAGWTKKLTGKPVITVGSVGLDTDFVSTFAEGKGAGPAGLERVEQMVAAGDVDLVAVGRAILADPAWPAKIREARLQEIRPFRVELLKVLT